MAANEIKISVDEEAVARAAATIREAVRRMSEALQYAQALAVEPWIIRTPQGELTAYLDEHNQVRHCHQNVRVPEAWRKIYVEKRA